eukprot:gene18564-39138_t
MRPDADLYRPTAGGAVCPADPAGRADGAGGREGLGEGAAGDAGAV